MQCDCGHGNSHVSGLLQVKLKYLNEISDVEDRLKLAMDYKVHSLAIDVSMYIYIYIYIYIYNVCIVCTVQDKKLTQYTCEAL